MRKKTKREEKLCRAESFADKILDMDATKTTGKKKNARVVIKQEERESK